MTYYSIYIPSKTDSEVNKDENQFVFTEFDEALKVLKNHKEARLKTFKNNEDATKFSQVGFEVCPIISTTGLKSPSATVTNLEKAGFRAPSKQELIQFRKAIEDNKYDVIEKKIWENPRYLINSGDTPTSLKDGTRYNALHVCAIHKKPEIADLILQSISKYRFIELLYGSKDEKLCAEVCEIMLDYYLNMPEKGRSETPLHLAVKYGCVEVVEVLTKYPQCKMTPNLEKLLPKDLICSRMDKPSQELKDRIAKLLEERFYVPVIRSMDNSLPPVIGEPFSPGNPPNLKNDLMSPELEIQAYAGPMNKEQAKTFRRRWKTPPRTAQSLNTSFSLNSPYITPKKASNNNLSTPNYKRSLFPNKSFELSSEDTENGNSTNSENILLDEIKTENNINNNIENVTFPIPISTPLRKNFKRDLFFEYREQIGSPLFDENCLNSSTNSDVSEKDPFESISLKERHIKIMDTEKGLELIGRELAKEQNIEWKEYWDFLGTFIDISSIEGLSQLENYLELKRKEYEILKNSNINKNNDITFMSNLCNAFDQIHLSKDKLINNENQLKTNEKSKLLINNQNPTASYLCVEKSFQVFAKRMTKTIIHNIDSIVSINDAFNSELKRLKSLVYSFKDDTRFATINFNFVHSRFANLIVIYLRNYENINNNIINKIQKCFQQIVDSKLKSMIGKKFRNQITDETEQLKCVTELILKYLNLKDEKILPENLKTEQICMETWSNERKCSCNWDFNTVRVQNRRKRLLSRHLNDNDTSYHSKISELNNIDLDKHQDTNSDNSDEEDIFWSDTGSSDDDDDIYYTPPESPPSTDLDISHGLFEKYNIYLLGDEPTKRDLDVINALFNVQIDRQTYPNIHRWRAAILRHSNDERDNFPSPSVIVKQHKSDINMTPKQLFTSSPCLSKMSSNNFRYINDFGSSSSLSNSSSNQSPKGNLSFMNISDYNN